MLPVENYEDLYRDPNNKGIVNANKKERDMFLQRKRNILKERDELKNTISNLEDRVKYLEQIILEKLK